MAEVRVGGSTPPFVFPQVKNLSESDLSLCRFPRYKNGVVGTNKEPGGRHGEVLFSSPFTVNPVPV